MADPPPARIPRYALRPDQRLALRAALASQTRLAKRLVPAEQVVRTMVSLNCYACHVRDSVGGPSPNRADYFTVTGTWELGDEGRIPPHLSSVGTKLRPEWLGEVMTNRGIARPYMASRMPQYGGANVRDLLSAYRIAEAWSTPDPPPTHDPSVARIGRELVGKSRLSCITCHVFQGRRPEGLPALDMALMTRRLEWAWFRRYVLEPQVLRPGTRMPAFWPGGQAAYKDLLEGATARQVEAVWLYLSGGSGAEPPVGVGTASGAPIPQRD